VARCCRRGGGAAARAGTCRAAAAATAAAAAGQRTTASQRAACFSSPVLPAPAPGVSGGPACWLLLHLPCGAARTSQRVGCLKSSLLLAGRPTHAHPSHSRGSEAPASTHTAHWSPKPGLNADPHATMLVNVHAPARFKAPTKHDASQHLPAGSLPPRFGRSAFKASPKQCCSKEIRRSTMACGGRVPVGTPLGGVVHRAACGWPGGCTGRQPKRIRCLHEPNPAWQAAKPTCACTCACAAQGSCAQGVRPPAPSPSRGHTSFGIQSVSSERCTTGWVGPAHTLTHSHGFRHTGPGASSIKQRGCWSLPSLVSLWWWAISIVQTTAKWAPRRLVGSGRHPRSSTSKTPGAGM
jgi:hypothetical protein